MTEFRDDGESLHGVGDCGVCVLCGAPPSTARINASVPFSICELHTHFAPAYYAVDTVRAAMREYARRVSNALSAPVRENPSTPECLHGPFCCQCEMNRLQAGEGPARFGDGEAREKAGETSDEQAYLATLQELLTCACSWDGDARLLGNVRAADMVQALMFAIERALGDFFEEENAWADRAQILLGRTVRKTYPMLANEVRDLKEQLAERTAEVERLKASKLCLSCLVEYEPPGNAGWRR